MTSATPLSKIFRALSDETRLKMFRRLAQGGEICVCEFMAELKITQSRASRHLRYLANAGLVDDRRSGVWVYYRLAEPVSPLLRKLVEMVRPSGKAKKK